MISPAKLSSLKPARDARRSRYAPKSYQEQWHTRH
jgi:hypothetical protein